MNQKRCIQDQLRGQKKRKIASELEEEALYNSPAHFMDLTCDMNWQATLLGKFYGQVDAFAIQALSESKNYLPVETETSLMERMLDVLLNDNIVDIIIRIGDMTFNCKRPILQFHSKYFAAHYNTAFIELPEGAITMFGFSMVYDWMLRERSFIIPGGFKDMFVAARFLGVEKLLAACWNCLGKHFCLCDHKLFRMDLTKYREDFLYELIRSGAQHFHVVLHTPKGFYIFEKNKYQKYLSHQLISPILIGNFQNWWTFWKYASKSPRHPIKRNTVYVGGLVVELGWTSMSICDFYKKTRDGRSIYGTTAIIVMGEANLERNARQY